jgi:hypothetical protein
MKGNGTVAGDSLPEETGASRPRPYDKLNIIYVHTNDVLKTKTEGRGHRISVTYAMHLTIL